jgi:uncharacterized protein YegL
MRVLRELLLLLVAAAASAALVKRQDSEEAIVYKLFHVDSLVVSRYAVTSITSVVQNSDPEQSKELEFRMQLPETAFISNFSMSVNGRTYYGVAKEKAEAEQEFEERISAGENAGLVQSRGSEVFSIRINTAADSEATFVLKYEELIVRRRSKYSYRVNLNPGSVVDDFQAQVRVVDPQGVVETAASDFVSSQRLSNTEVVFSYQPSADQQREDSTEYGLGRDLDIEFDVTPTSVSVGEFVVDRNCYFAQFFSKTGAEAVPVDLVFVIDVSGSMSGTKITQTREALETIINQLRDTDRFTMLTFSTNVRYWREDLVLASEYRFEGVKFAKSLQAGGGTNFNAGLLNGTVILKRRDEFTSQGRIPLLVMLTDGEPTEGVTDEDKIVANAREALTGTSISLNCLGFGQNLNFQLLERLALQNDGIVRTIYEGDDAAEQLEGFFDEISTPVLQNIKISYDENSVKTSSATEFPLLFEGGEIVVAGQCNKDTQNIDVEVVGTGTDGQVSFTAEISTNPTSIVGGYSPSTERLQAYLLIQQLLNSRLASTNQSEIEANLQKALDLSLKYNFVTELTSLIVVEEVGSGSNESRAGNETLIGGGNVVGGEENFANFPGVSSPPTQSNPIPDQPKISSDSGASSERPTLVLSSSALLLFAALFHLLLC